MASSKEYLDYVLEQLSLLEEISYRKMMGEYLLYFQGKLFAGVYDNRFLVKKINSAINLMPDAKSEVLYPGAKEMLVVDKIEDKEFLKELIEKMYLELPDPK